MTLDRLAVLAVALPTLLAAQGRPMPARFDADRVFLELITPRGDTLLFYTDTGGGSNMLYPSGFARAGLTARTLVLGRDTVRVVPFPTLRSGLEVPPGDAGPPFGTDLLLVSPPAGLGISGDGFLGRTWFADRRWEFDYLTKRLTLLPSGTPEARGPNDVSLGFQTDSTGRRTTHFPRIRVRIAGDSLDLLFDTGAHSRLTDSAQRLLGRAQAEMGSSFIADTVANRWRARHPDWRVIVAGEAGTGADLIEVPTVEVGGHTVGPVWFAVRPTRNFHQYMSQWMDRRIDGALGGSALRYFRVTIDYPNAVARFER